LKISFANEVGSLAARVGADPARLMDAFVLDRKLNISAVYLRPGFAFGGSCLSKDIRGLLHTGRSVGLELPLCESILSSNERHLERALAAVLSHPGQVVGLAGLVFKAHTDDVRESPAMWLARRILDHGRTLLIYEPEISIDRLVGANHSFMLEHLPEYPRCLVDWETVAGRADVVALVRPGVISAAARNKLAQPVIELFRLESL
jgi:GDP-mannose 6-dehydrogenase